MTKTWRECDPIADSYMLCYKVAYEQYKEVFSSS